MRWSLVAALAAFTLMAGCVEGLGAVEKIRNNVDQFEYGGNFYGKDGTKTFAWETTGTVAAVNWGTANAESGSVKVTVKDAAGTTVYTGTLKAGAKAVQVADGVTGTGTSQYSKTGTAGDWTVEVTFTDYTGLMGVSLAKKGREYETSAEPSDAPQA